MTVLGLGGGRRCHQEEIKELFMGCRGMLLIGRFLPNKYHCLANYSKPLHPPHSIAPHSIAPHSIAPHSIAPHSEPLHSIPPHFQNGANNLALRI